MAHHAAANADARATPAARLRANDRDHLLAMARDTIRQALADAGRMPAMGLDGLNARMVATRASFVTLWHAETGLRGCVGSFPAQRALAHDVCRNAYRAAFDDPRFPPLTPAEEPALTVGVSVLDAPEPLPAGSEAEVLARLRPGVDGVVLQGAGTAGLFLPQVWDKLPEPEDFLRELKAKAGLAADAWPADVRVQRFTVEHFAEDDAG